MSRYFTQFVQFKGFRYAVKDSLNDDRTVKLYRSPSYAARIAKEMNAEHDATRYHVLRHTAPMTGAAWFVVVDTLGWEQGSQVGPYYDDFDDAQANADSLNATKPEAA